jgi:hypothetical protein
MAALGAEFGLVVEFAADMAAWWAQAFLAVPGKARHAIGISVLMLIVIIG